MADNKQVKENAKKYFDYLKDVDTSKRENTNKSISRNKGYYSTTEAIRAENAQSKKATDGIDFKEAVNSKNDFNRNAMVQRYKFGGVIYKPR